MIYKSGNDWLQSPKKRVMLFGMSGLGKTYISQILRDTGDWFHYSVDYRIGTRYMGEHIVDNFKKEAMRNPFLADLLRSDSIYIASNIRFHDLSPLSTYLGKPGNPAKGGIPFDEYIRRQRQHRAAEINAMKDTVQFIERAHELYAYDNFVCDTSGSMVEVSNGSDPKDEVLSCVSQYVLPIWIDGGAQHTDVLVERFKKAPKPMYYPEDLLAKTWDAFVADMNVSADEVDPDEFIVYGYRKLLEDRLPRYRQIAQNWGVTVQSKDVSNVRTSQDFYELVAKAIDS